MHERVLDELERTRAIAVASLRAAENTTPPQTQSGLARLLDRGGVHFHSAFHARGNSGRRSALQGFFRPCALSQRGPAAGGATTPGAASAAAAICVAATDAETCQTDICL